MRVTTKPRPGVSLLEVLISIGVIALGIFGVATLIPVAQFQVAEGTRLDRQAALGPSAVAEFRIRGMNSTANWTRNSLTTWVAPPITAVEANRGLPSRAVVIDPLGYLALGEDAPQLFFPAASTTDWALPRFNLKATPNLPLAQRIFYLQDDLDFDRPADQGQQPRRKYFTDSNGRPLMSAPEASLTWFATLSPYSAVRNFGSDEFLLSIVICAERIPELAAQINTEEGEFEAAARTLPTDLAGDLWIEKQPFVDQLQIGDWILIGKNAWKSSAQGMPNPPTTLVPGPGDVQSKRIYRWAQIIGVNAGDAGNFRKVVIANDDLVLPGETARVFYVKGIESVYERTIRLETTSTVWDE